MKTILTSPLLKSVLIALTGLALPAFAADGYVQGKTGTGFTVSTLDIAMNSNVTSGNVIAIGVRMDAGLTLSSVARQSGTAALGTCAVLDSDNHTVASATAWCPVTGTGSLTARITLSGSSAGVRAIITEMSAPTQTVDQHDVRFQAGSTTPDAITSPTKTTTSDGQQIWAFLVEQGSMATITAGTNYTIREIVANTVFTETRDQTSKGAIAATFTSSSGIPNFTTYIVTFGTVADERGILGGGLGNQLLE